MRELIIYEVLGFPVPAEIRYKVLKNSLDYDNDPLERMDLEESLPLLKDTIKRRIEHGYDIDDDWGVNIGGIIPHETQEIVEVTSSNYVETLDIAINVILKLLLLNPFTKELFDSNFFNPQVRAYKTIMDLLNNRGEKDKYNSVKKLRELLKDRGISYNEYLQLVQGRQLTTIFKKNKINDTFFIPKTENKDDDKPEEFILKKLNFILNTNITYENRTSYFTNYKPTVQGYLQFCEGKNTKLKDFFFRTFPIKIPVKETHKHTYIIAGSGSGKSELLKVMIYRHIMQIKASIVLIEPHGDLAEQVAKLKFYNKDSRLLYVDLFLKKGYILTINPFELEDKSQESINSLAQEIKEAFKEILASDFTDNMEALLIPCIATLLKKGNCDLFDLQRFMNDEVNEDLVNLGTKSPVKSHSNFFKNGFYNSNLSSSKKALFTRLQILLNDETFANAITGKSTIDLENAVNDKNKIIIFKLSKEKMSQTLTPYGSFIVAMLKSIAFRRAKHQEQQRTHTHLFIDEFQNFISPSIETILTEARKYKLFLTMANQVLSQLETTKLKDIVLSNTNIKLVGKNGVKTAQAMGREISVDPERIQELKVGGFYTKVGSKPVFRLQAPTFLMDKKQYDSSESWQKVKEQQIEMYYKKLDDKPQEPSEGEQLSQEIKEHDQGEADEQEIIIVAGDDNREKIKVKANLKPKFDDF